MKSGKSFQIFLLFLQTNASVPCKKGRWYLILFCSISDTNYHLEKRLLAKNANPLKRVPISAGFSIGFVWVVVDPCQSMVGLR